MLTNRWAALAILFLGRLGMAFQFQAVAALGPLYVARQGIGIADLGMLIGLYLFPGIVFALPGGGIARMLGDRRVVALALLLMVAGGLLVWQAPAWEAQITGRLLAGTGGVLVNVVMTKMLQDWFAGREIATAMGIFVNSWPAGIALALVVLPPFAEAHGVEVALGVTFAITVAALMLFLAFYRDPPVAGRAGTNGSWPIGRTLYGIILAGLIWALYNAALSMVFSFGPTLLVERGYPLPEASAITSLVLWLTALSVPAGGIIADRIGRPDAVLVFGLVAFGLTFLLALQGSAPYAVFVVMGLVCGLPAGPAMALPSRVLTATTRAMGMGLFFTIYYIAMPLAPFVAGALSDRTGDLDVAFQLAIGLIALALLTFVLFRREFPNAA